MTVKERIVGRDQETRRIAQFLDHAAEGPAALVVEGEQGIGKSALLDAGLQAARGRGYRDLASRPAESEADLAFAGVGDLLAGTREQLADVLPPPQARALRVALFEEAQGPGDSAPPRRGVSMAFLSAIRALAAVNPVLILVDDLQWLDGSTAQVLEFAVRRLEGEPVGILTAVRSGGLRGSQEALVRALAEATRIEFLPVGPLEIGAIQELLRRRLQATLPAPTLAQLRTASAGNPLYAMEIARAIRPSAPSGQRLSIPKSLRDLVHERLALLPPPAIEVLLAVAALSRPTVAMAERAIGSRDRTEIGLKAALEKDIITIEEEAVIGVEPEPVLALQPTGRIRFTHPLLGSALYADTPAQDRRELHRRLATIVTDPEEEARHLALATETFDEPVAGKLEEAATRARGRGAPDAGAEFMEHAIRLTPSSMEDAARRRMVLSAQYHFESGDTRRARALLEKAVEASTPGPSRADALRRLGWLRYHEDSYDAASLLLRGALEEAGDDVSLRVAIERDLAWAALRFGHVSSAARHARAALQLAESLDDVVGLAEALTAVGMAEMVLGRGIRADILQRAMELERQGEQLRITQHPSRTFGLLLKSTDDLERARARYGELHDLARRRGDEASLPFLLHHLSDIEWRTGGWAQAEAFADEGLLIAERTGQEPARAALLYSKALVHAHQGRVDQAREEAELGRVLAERVGAPALALANQAVLGFVELSLGYPIEAERHLGHLADLVSAMRLGDPEVMRFLPDQIEVLVSLGNLTEARSVLPRLERGGRVLGRLWTRATAGRCRALILAAEGDLGTAAKLLDRSVPQHEQLGQPFALARALVTLGVVQRRTKQKKVARTSLRRAAEIFEELGAPLWTQLAGKELGRIAGRAPGPLALTPTEERVANLVVSGRSNAEVASTLFMSPKTVATNLSRIYAKLGVRSRTELAAKMLGGATSSAEEATGQSVRE